jgi:D-alanine-D-alanine ligase
MKTANDVQGGPSMTDSSLQHKSPLRILLLAGGPSAERDVSLQSGAAVARSLRSLGHQVTEYDPQQGMLDGIQTDRFDVVFNALHGTFGEDGQVQSLLDDLGLPFTGSDAMVSRLTMSKSATKEQLRAAALPTPEYAVIESTESAESIRRKASVIGYPMVIKPDAEGSSLGVTIVPSDLDLPAALTRCFHYGSLGLMESCVHGQEWTVGLIDDEVLPPIQIVSPSEFYDYESKYISEKTEYLFETNLPPVVLETLQQIALEATRSIGTRGIVRVDFRLDRFHQPWVLELNTVPGMTSHSLIPKGAAKVGISFEEVCQRAIQSALAAHREQIRPAA